MVCTSFGERKFVRNVIDVHIDWVWICDMADIELLDNYGWDGPWEGADGVFDVPWLSSLYEDIELLYSYNGILLEC